MGRLLVGTVFAESKYNKEWSAIQQRFLAKTTANYDTIAYLNRVDPSEVRGYEIVGSHYGPKPLDFPDMSKEHCRGLNKLLDHFKNSNQYDNLLILDSDCFPIYKKWQKLIVDKMAERSKLGAAVIRFENLTTFPHPCALVISRRLLGQGWFRIEVGGTTNLFGEHIKDTCGSLPSDKFYPLIRTNTWNPHPVFFALYGDMFYHHGCGSRTPHFRAQEYYLRQYDVTKHWDAFFESPEHFISLLQGDNKRRIKI